MSSLSLICSECGQGLPTASRFCDQCGTPVVVSQQQQHQTTNTNLNIDTGTDTNTALQTDFDLLGLLNQDNTTTPPDSLHSGSAPVPAVPPIAHFTTTTTSTSIDDDTTYEDLFNLAGKGGGGGGDDVGAIDDTNTGISSGCNAPQEEEEEEQLQKTNWQHNDGINNFINCNSTYGDSDGPVFSVSFENGVPTTLEVGPDAYNRATVVTALPEQGEKDEEEEGVITGAQSGHQRRLCVGDQILEINGELVSGDGPDKIRERLAALSAFSLQGGEGGGGRRGGRGEQQEQQSCKLKLRRRVQESAHGDGDGYTDGVVEGTFSTVFNVMPWANGSAMEHESMLMIHNTKSALYEPPDHMDMVYGYVERFRGDKMITFHFKRESDDQFILAASMEAGGKGKIVFHSMQEITHRGTVNQLPSHSHSAAFYGTCCQNLLGTEFVIRDYHVSNPTVKETRGRVHELGLIRYESNIMGRVPNSITAILPRYDAETSLRGQRETLHTRIAKLAKKRRNVDKSMIEAIRTGNEKEYSAVELEEMEDLLMFDTKKPSWNEKLGAWTLNFNGRVKVASKKNFLLVPDSTNEAMDDEFGGDTVCLRFGKVSKHRFSLDYRHPMSPTQAFGICLTTFATKLAVT